MRLLHAKQGRKGYKANEEHERSAAPGACLVYAVALLAADGRFDITPSRRKFGPTPPAEPTDDSGVLDVLSAVGAPLRVFSAGHVTPSSETLPSEPSVGKGVAK